MFSAAYSSLLHDTSFGEFADETVHLHSVRRSEATSSGLHATSFEQQFTDEQVRLYSDPIDTTMLGGAGLRAFLDMKSALLALESAKAQSVGVAKATFAAAERSAEAQQTAQATGYMASMNASEAKREVDALYTKKAAMQARSATMGAASDAPRVAKVLEEASRQVDIAVRTVAAASGMKSGLKPLNDVVPGFTDGAFLGLPGVNIITKVHPPNEPFVPADVGIPPVALDMPYALTRGTDPYIPYIRGGKFMVDPYRMAGQQAGPEETDKPHFIEPLGGPTDIVTGIIQKLTKPNVIKPYVPGVGTFQNAGALEEGVEEHPAGEEVPEDQEVAPEPGTTDKEVETPEEPAPDKNAPPSFGPVTVGALPS
eukprot:gnl/MRDRNA2_/MRDRNA2_54435_c0_seq1.p1 gnl/MRDRNA2_/MRDRNA2_54435_c0~~gnl/MRDRNA2_/MRDRNA2_54435_c0_seq1.p1  ORF type:complete len:369 (-),score=72.53 gnl/MRDRNA2_/MRDRNA2_54435_c0_seq1:148-1254(-)